MASLVIPTGVPSHPQISIDSLDLASGRIGFRWLGGPYAGDCSDEFVISLETHGELTVNQMVTAIRDAMVAKLPGA